jgi:hypothetical protein
MPFLQKSFPSTPKGHNALETCPLPHGSQAMPHLHNQGSLATIAQPLRSRKPHLISTAFPKKFPIRVPIEGFRGSAPG